MGTEGEKILTNLRKGVLEFCVLAALSAGRRYGRDLAHALGAEGLLAGEGTLYPLLSRLRTTGLVETEWAESDAGRQRRYYTLTPSGIERLNDFRAAWYPLQDTVNALMEDSQ